MVAVIPNIGNLDNILSAYQICLILIYFIILHLHHSMPYIPNNMLIVAISYLLIGSIMSSSLSLIMIRINDPFRIEPLKCFQDRFSWV